MIRTKTRKPILTNFIQHSIRSPIKHKNWVRKINKRHPNWKGQSKTVTICRYLTLHTNEKNEVAQSCQTICDPMDCSLPGSSVHGNFQATVLEWGAIAFSDMRIYLSPITWLLEIPLPEAGIKSRRKPKKVCLYTGDKLFL